MFKYLTIILLLFLQLPLFGQSQKATPRRGE